ncbi:NAD-glutamate dehydrogenase [Bogoriella caseilytica]|uniref:Glutamate dehydrogenase n=1 Tax=Bogoriella caseilytica TaxID=56055 RepID=A0A3N2BC44_9MICO|nr:NAD-glutamate dehydrogenase [Bogoriella caseilytica]ROR72798.1 glutamate dehydrogenase [Bogoriella caseilytica]
MSTWSSSAPPTLLDRASVLRHAAAEADAVPGAPSGSEAEALLEGYFHDVLTDDLQAQPPRVLLGSAVAHRRLAATREEREAVVEVFTPQEETHGWHTGMSVVQIVTDDMPFLVDSVLGELDRRQAAVRLLVHPQPAVRRDRDGALVEIVRGAEAVAAVGTETPEGVVVRESWIYVQIAGLAGEELDTLAADLRRVLADVRVGVEDHAAMEAQARDISALLYQEPPAGVDTDEITETRQLLDWLVAGHFVFLGYREYDFHPDEPEGSASLSVRAGSGLGLLRAGADTAGKRLELPPAVAKKAGEPRLLIVTKANSVSTVHRPRHLDYIGIKTFDDLGQVTGERRFLGLFTAAAANWPVTEVPVISRAVNAVFERTGFSRQSHLGKDLLDVLKTYPRSELFQAGIDHLTEVALAVVHLHVRPRTRLFLRRDDYERYTSCLVYIPRDRYTPGVKDRIISLLSKALAGAEVRSEESVTESPLAQLHVVVRVAPGERAPEADVATLEDRVATAARTWAEQLAEASRDQLGRRGPELAERFTFPSGYQEDFTLTEAVEDLRQLGALLDTEAARSAGEGAAEGRGGAEPELGGGREGGTEAARGAGEGGVEGRGGAEPELAESVAEDDSSPLGLRLYTPDRIPGRPVAPGEQRLKLYRHGDLPLSAVLPIFTSLGLEVIDERPHTLGESDGRRVYLYDFGLRTEDVEAWHRHDADSGESEGADAEGDLRRRLEEAFLAAWHGHAETDGLGALVLLAGLSWRQVQILRALTSYLRQAGSIYSREYVEDALLENPDFARGLVALFEARFDPDRFNEDESESRAQAEHEISEALTAALDDVVSLNTDRILRALLATIHATVRTSYYCGPGPIDDPSAVGEHRPTIALKLDPERLSFLPEPRPWAEIWVYGVDVEGVHLRYGPVARGGLRWSDRREDFRTEVLGLVKAQAVKNAIIVPVGAKGGFVAKRLPDPADRDVWYQAGTQAYRLFISSLLDVTDNLDTSVPAGSGDRPVIPPERVVRHDDDDPYLVVAADKGTASFSDVANAVAADYGYWLDDAFASGGSQGYDHKAMGITARGAWEAVKRHFRDLDLNTQAESFSVVGIGDMSGDVFGNGMLLSEHIHLVAAFNHQHIFLDPTPDAAASFAERRRLFEAGRTTWEDYDRSLISEGGGVWSRTMKAIPIAAPVREVLGVDAGVTELTPPELIRAILTAPVDLLWNGGIGTYVKASSESHDDIGDRANDLVRVDGSDLRCRVVGEGGNLGLSQLGRVEAAHHGVRLNTDAIDNSAGVDSSDHEVNLKILLASAEGAGELQRSERDEVLVSLTDDVARRVLRQNYEQSVLLGNARTVSRTMAGAHIRLMHWLEERGDLDRTLEFLPSDVELEERGGRGEGLTSPEFAVLAAYTKLALKAELLASDLPDESWFQCELEGYFPEGLRQRFAQHIAAHPLRREIIATRVANSVVNRGGTTFVYRAMEETGASPVEVVRAFVVAREVFTIAEFVSSVESLDNEVDAATQADLYLEFRRLLDRSVRWLVQRRPEGIDVGAEVERFSHPVSQLRAQLPELLLGTRKAGVERRAAELAEQGVPGDLAELAAGLVAGFTKFDVVALAEAHEAEPEEVARVRAAVEEYFSVDRLLDGVEALPREDRWESLARFALRDDLYSVLSELTAAVLGETGAGADATARVEEWAARRAAGVERSRRSVAEVAGMDDPGLAALQVAVRALRAARR